LPRGLGSHQGNDRMSEKGESNAASKDSDGKTVSKHIKRAVVQARTIVERRLSAHGHHCTSDPKLGCTDAATQSIRLQRNELEAGHAHLHKKVLDTEKSPACDTLDGMIRRSSPRTSLGVQARMHADMTLSGHDIYQIINLQKT
jgi:hypothetical protein